MRLLLAALLGVALLAGCLSDSPGEPVPPADTTVPPPASAADVAGFEHVASPRFNESARASVFGEWVEDGIAYLSGPAGLRIVDVRDPANPVVLAEDVPDTDSRDVDLIHHPNGRLYAVLADSQESYMKLVDVTDPSSPQLVGTTRTCVHTVAVVPGTAVVYGSWSLCHVDVPGQPLDGDVEIIDFTDPMNPVSKLYVFPPVAMVGGVPRPVSATSCHEMTFNAELKRAYCAGITDTLVWDISDPLDPVIISVIDDPLVNIHHSVWDARNGTLLIIGDEFAGVLAPTPTCSDEAELPTSGLAFYDMTDLSMPRRVGYYNIPYDAVAASAEAGAPQYCSTHLGDVIEGADLIVMGWYTAGIVMVDFSEPSDAKTVATWRAEGQPTSVWEARYHDGHVFVADAQHGLDILALVAPEA
jgi:hypothetical protein